MSSLVQRGKDDQDSNGQRGAVRPQCNRDGHHAVGLRVQQRMLHNPLSKGPLVVTPVHLSDVESRLLRCMVSVEGRSMSDQKTREQTDRTWRKLIEAASRRYVEGLRN